MAKTKISELDAAAANNTDINSVDVSEGCAPSGINNAIREMGAMLKRMDNGTDHLTNPNITGDLDVDNININGNTISSTDTNGNVTVDPNGTGQINLSANVDVTGTVTADGLGVGIASPAYDAHIHESDSGNSLLHFTNATTGTTGSDGFTVGLDASEQAILLHRENTSMVQYTNGTQRLRLENNGDISFYADNGTTQGLFWDASTQRLGLGTTSPSFALEVNAANGGGLSVVGASDTNSGWRLKPLGNDLYISQNGISDNVVFKDGGNVGIGITPAAGNGTLQLSGGLRLAGSASASDTTSPYIFRTSGADNMVFATSGSEAARIDSSGHFLLNTTSEISDGRLSIAEPLNTGVGISIKNNVAQGAGQTFIRFLNNSGTVTGSIQHTGTTTVAYSTSSDYRLKENVADMTGAIDRVKALAPKRFNFIADADTTVDGFLAHEAQAVVPEAVTGTHNEVDEDGNPVMQGIDQSKLVPLLTGALREAIAKIETLETQRADLEARLTALEGA